MRKIVGLVGKLGSGKDTVASFLVEFGWERIAFSDALYKEVSQAFDVSVDFLQTRTTKETPLPELALEKCADKDFIYGAALPEFALEEVDSGVFQDMNTRLTAPRSPRRILQIWGTEYRRRLHTDGYWRNKVANIIRNNPYTHFVVTDVRFPDEAQMLENLGGEIARVIRIAEDGVATQVQDARTGHSSETSMESHPVSQVLVNRNGSEGLAKLGANVIKTFVQAPKITDTDRFVFLATGLPPDNQCNWFDIPGPSKDIETYRKGIDKHILNRRKYPLNIA